MNSKNKNELEFYEQKWFKLILLFSFIGWMFYKNYKPFEIDKNELVELKVTVDKEWGSSGPKNPIRLYFTVKEFSNRFGIYRGGIFGRWTEVTEILEKNRKIIIKIHKNNKEKLNISTDVIPIYYLSSNKRALVFNEEKFNEGEKSSKNRIIGFLLFIFLLGMWKILKD